MSDSESIPIRSHSNPTIRHLVRLRDNRTRRREKCLLVDGLRETRQAIAANLPLLGLFVTEHTADSIDHEIQFIVSHARRLGVLRTVSDDVMEKIAYGQSSRGVVAQFAEPTRSLGALKLPDHALVLILDCLEKPGNIGAVLRCADAVGVDAVLLCGSGSDVFNPNAIRSSLGTVFRLQTASASEAEIADFLQERRIRVLAARVESATEIWTTDFSGSIAIVVGSEADGLGDRWQTLAGQPIAGVRIPMFGEVDSLNVSVSAAVILFEAKRQRQTQ